MTIRDQLNALSYEELQLIMNKYVKYLNRDALIDLIEHSQKLWHSNQTTLDDQLREMKGNMYKELYGAKDQTQH